MPPTSSPITSTSPVCSPARTSQPEPAHRLDDARAQRIAARGTVEGRQEAVAGRLDLAAAEAAQLARGRRRCGRPAAARQRSSPISAARWVEPTRSVNSTVASTRSGSRSARRPVRNSSTSDTRISGSSTRIRLSHARQLDVARAGDLRARGSASGRCPSLGRRGDAGRASARGSSAGSRARRLAWTIAAAASRRSPGPRRAAAAAHPLAQAAVAGLASGPGRRCIDPSPQLASKSATRASRAPASSGVVVVGLPRRARERRVQRRARSARSG